MHINMKMIMGVIWSDGEVTKSLRCLELRLLRRLDLALVMMMLMIKIPSKLEVAPHALKMLSGWMGDGVDTL